MIFLHKIKNGAVDKSYGIHVAKLAGLPEQIISDANDILAQHEKQTKKKKNEEQIQFVMEFPEEKEDPIKEKLKNADILHMTPLEAINFIYELKEELK